MAHYSRVTLASLKTRLTARVGGNAVFWPPAEQAAAINEAIRVWGALTGQWSTTFQLVAPAGTTFYDVPRQIVSLLRVKFGTSVLDHTSLFELDNGVVNWQNATGTPLRWAPIGLNKFALYPAPSVPGTLTLEGISLAPAMFADGDFLDLGDEEIERLLDYAHFYLTFKEGTLETQGGTALFDPFLESAVLRNKRLLASAYFRRYVGQVRDEQERPARSGRAAVGARG